MIEIYVDEINAQVRRVASSEVMIDPREDEPFCIEIDLLGNTDLTLRMPMDCAEDLFNALAMHFQGAPD